MLKSLYIAIRKQVYLDNNATTKISGKVVRVMNRILKKNFGNPSSLYTKAIQSAIILDESRSAIAKAICADTSEIYFTGSATEANNMILKMLTDKYFPQKNKILVTPIEHASVISTIEYLQQKGVQIEYIPVDKNGFVDCLKLEQLIDEKTFLICCMYANNETGVIQNINKISEIAHNRSVLLMSDCVQAFGKIPVDVKLLDVDYATFSAHKIHGPKGVGALYVKSGNYISSFIHGGHQEGGFRAGTESIHNIAGFAEACRHLPDSIKKAQKTVKLKQNFIKKLKTIKPDIQINSPEEYCLPNTINITFPGINNAYFLATLDFFQIAVSAGSACNTQSNTASHVLKAIGLSDDEARETLRFSFDDLTTKSDLIYTLRVIRKFIQGHFSEIGMIEPKQLDEQMLNNPDFLILDARFWYDRIFMKSLPQTKEISFYKYKSYFKILPKDKHIIVICQGGYLSPVVAYNMKEAGFPRVSFLMLGMDGWKKANPDLFEKLIIQNA